MQHITKTTQATDKPRNTCQYFTLQFQRQVFELRQEKNRASYGIKQAKQVESPVKPVPPVKP